MAENKRKRSREGHTSRLTRFPEVKGKIVDVIEIDDDAAAISIVFQDKTLLSFDLDHGLTVYPELSQYKTGQRKTGDWHTIKRWPAVRSSPSMVKWL